MTESKLPAVRRFSVVMPAHNEQAVLARTLNAFLPDLSPGEAQTVVVANGCTDRTVDIARGFGNVEVIEIEPASKAAALNVGDRAADRFPRLYVDADVTLTATTLRELARALDAAEPRVASPSVRFVLAGRPWIVKAFYSIFSALPYMTDGLIGGGAYGLSATGRARFDEFPSATADDLFVQRLFTLTERITLPGHFVEVHTPTTLRGLIAIRTRTAYGNRELAHRFGDAYELSARQTIGALARLLARRPYLAANMTAYIGVVLLARFAARRRRAGTWQRDQSSRTPG